MTRITSGLPVEEQETVVQLDRQTRLQRSTHQIHAL